MTLRLNNDNGNSASIDYVDGVTTDSTITIPEGNGTVAMVGAGGGLAGNISRATIFRLSADFSTDNARISGWQAIGQEGTASVGGPVLNGDGALLDGQFSFPVTGIWMVSLNANMLVAANDTTVNVELRYTTDAWTSNNTRATGNVGASGSNQVTGSIYTCAILDIENIATHMVQFIASSLSAGSQVRGSANQNLTTVTFLRLGDT